MSNDDIEFCKALSIVNDYLKSRSKDITDKINITTHCQSLLLLKEKLQ